MTRIFSQVLNMSVTGSVVILLVMFVRLLMKKSPKVYSYALWAVVMFRLLCPVSLSASISALGWLQPEVTGRSEITTFISYVPVEESFSEEYVSEDYLAVERPDSGDIRVEEVAEWDLATIFAYLWVSGAVLMLLWSSGSWIQLKLQLIGALHYRGNVYLSDYIDSPFVLGILRPRIYLPSTIPSGERLYIITHERYHIRRLDHIVKLLAYIALCIHWFNPLAWAAFILAGRDMEMSCDEAVIKQLGVHIRADYSASLLRLATHKKIIAGMPLAFGEGDTKGRVINMAKWKKPKPWISVLCIVCCIAVLAACGMNPETSPTESREVSKDTTSYVEVPVIKSAMPEEFSYQVNEGDTDILVITDSTGNIVGGVSAYPIPDGVYDAGDKYFDWLFQVGIPDFEDPSLAYMGGMTSGDYGWLAEFSSDVPPGTEITVDHRHHCYPIGNVVYDIWFDMLKVDYITSENLRLTIQLPWEQEQVYQETEPPKDGEQAAFQKCASIMEAIQEENYQILSQQNREGNEGPAGYIRTYYSLDGDKMSTHTVLTEGENITEAGEYYNRLAYLSVGDQFFSNEGHQGERGEIIWVESTPPEYYTGPWMERFSWITANVSYMDTMKDENGECIMFRVDKKYEDIEGYSDAYFVNFYFDSEGNFLNVKLQVNLFQENEFSVRESIVTLEDAVIRETLDREFRRATQ